jgi:hypothetical protein
MARLQSNTTIYGTANVQSSLNVGYVTPFTSTSNTTGSLVVTGGVGISGNTWIGGNVGIGSASAGLSGPQISFANNTSNWITWNASGVNAPTLTTSSPGTKLLLYPGVGASATDYAIGIGSSTLWQSIANSLNNNQFNWYGGTTQVMSLTGAGNLLVSNNIQIGATAIANANLVIGTTSQSGVNLQVSNNIVNGLGTTAWGQLNNGVVQSTVTATAGAVESQVSAASTAFTLTTLTHFYANPFAATSSTITNQNGFYAESTLGTQGAGTITNAYGFYGNIAAATNRYNLYMAGTANNYIAGSLYVSNNVPSTSNTTGSLVVTGGSAITGNLNMGFVGTNAGIITTTYAPSTATQNAAAQLFGTNTKGGSTYFDFIWANNTTNNTSNKFFRIAPTANLQIVNSAYTQTILDLSDTGILNLGQVTAATSNVTGTLVVAGGAGIKGTIYGGAQILSATGIGYPTGQGAGGTVTQGTSRTTGVTLNALSGTITLFTTTLAAQTSQSFTFTNSYIAATDLVLVQHQSGGTLGGYTFAVTPASGSASIAVRSTLATSTTPSEAPVLQFAVIKAATN